MQTFLLVIHSLLALGIVGFVLLQRSESDGFGGSSGGSGLISGQAKANFLTRSTAILATLFMISSLGLAVMANQKSENTLVDAIRNNAPVTTPAEAMPSEGMVAPKKEVPLAE